MRLLRARILRNTPTIRNTLKLVAQGRPLAAEENSARLTGRLQAKLRISQREAQYMADAICQKPGSAAPTRTRGGIRTKPAGPEAIWGDTLDFVGVAFLEKGLRAARSVARVAFTDGLKAADF